VRPIYITGFALWAKGFPSFKHFVEGSLIEAQEEPACSWVPSRLLRGSSRLTRMFGEVAGQATQHASADPKTIATVYTSSYGEIETMVMLLDVIFRGDGQISPMRFKNSVHNAGSGLGSIGQGNMAFSTALAAGPRSFEAGMLEAIALLEERGGDVVVSCADDAVPMPLGTLDEREALAVGIALSTDRTHARMQLTEVTQAALMPAPQQTFGRPLSAGWLANPAVHALPLLEHLHQGRGGQVVLAPDEKNAFAVMLETL